MQLKNLLKIFYRARYRATTCIVTPLFVAGLAACAPVASDPALPLEMMQTFSDSGIEVIPDRWWMVFQDENLDGLVEEALRSNFNLATAWQKLREARAIAARESSSLFPDLEARLEAEAGRQETIENQELRLGLASTYEIDLWGRIRSSIEAENYRAAATYADYQTAALTLSAEVARSWYQFMATGNELDLLNEQIAINTRILTLIKNRFGSGQTRSVDILRQRQLLEATREQKIQAESRLQVLQHQLAVLLGRPPREAVIYPVQDLPEIPPLPDTGLPLELVRRRPDIVRAYNNLAAADRDLAAAVSRLYPRLTLSGSLATVEDTAETLFEEWAYSLAGSLTAPLIDGGEKRADIDRAEALKKQRLYEYGQVILTAFREVEDALIREKKQLERVSSLEQQIGYAERTRKQLRIQYFNGVTNYIEVLVSLTAEQQLRRELLAAKLLVLELRIALYRALAGSFKTEREAGQWSIDMITEPHPDPDAGYSRVPYGSLAESRGNHG